MNICISYISIIISSVSLFSWLLMYERIYIVILIAPYEHIKNIIFILNSTGWLLVLLILIQIVDLIICGVRVWIAGCLWEWKYQIVHLIFELCLLNGIDDDLMVCIVFWLWSSFRSNSYEFIYILLSAIDFVG